MPLFGWFSCCSWLCCRSCRRRHASRSRAALCLCLATPWKRKTTACSHDAADTERRAVARAAGSSAALRPDGDDNDEEEDEEEEDPAERCWRRC